jgi:hypothetical protein
MILTTLRYFVNGKWVGSAGRMMNPLLIVGLGLTMTVASLAQQSDGMEWKRAGSKFDPAPVLKAWRRAPGTNMS